MPSIIESGHFVPLANLNSIDSNQRLSDVYRQLSQAPLTGSFILREPGRSEIYVKAPALAHAISTVVGEDFSKWEMFCSMPLGEVIARVPTTGVFVDIDNRQVEANSEEENLRRVPDRVFTVAQRGRIVGWYLNHESALNVSTKRTVFICARGHRNKDPDTGTCYTCPAPIVKTEQE
jgi:hypothetical protein